MDVAVAEDTHEMQRRASRIDVVNRVLPDRFREGFPAHNRIVDSSTTLQNNLTGTDSVMANFAVAHVALRNADPFAAGVNRNIWVFV